MAVTFTKLICCILIVLVEGVVCLAMSPNNKPKVIHLIPKKYGTVFGSSYIFHDGNSSESSLTVYRNDERKDTNIGLRLKLQNLLRKIFSTSRINLFLRSTFLPSGFPLSLAASKFRSDVKRWRIFADIINDVGITLEMSATLVSQKLFLLMICLGNMCKALCGVASGACGGVINLHWAQGSDISDINAKFGAQVSIFINVYNKCVFSLYDQSCH